jgi:nitroreductase/Na+-translocating ferredoxin:NAD+ oxidoreductase RnfG subunit
MANTNRILKIFALIAGMAVIVLSSGKIFNYDLRYDENAAKNKAVVLTDKTKFFPEIAEDFSYYELDSVQDCYYLYDSKDKLSCSVIFSSPYCDSIEGFGGTIPLAIVFDSKNKIKQLYLFENSETPSWIESLTTDGFFNSWNGLSANEALDKKVDAVSGATFSSTAVIETVNSRLSKFCATKQNTQGKGWLNILGIISSFIVLIFAVFSFLVPHQTTRYRIFLLLGSVGILGFWQGNFISIALLNNWLINGLDIWAQLFLFVLLFLSILLPLVTNKSFYCQFVCPFGAAQELVGKLNKKKVVLSTSITSILKYVSLVFLFVIAVLIVVAVDVSIENFEPFSAFKFQFASLAVLILAIVMLFLSVFFNKPWCRYFCPTGAFLGLLRGKSDKAKKKQIKIPVLLNIVLAIGVLVMIYVNFLKPDNAQTSTQTKETVIMSSTLDVIHSRKSVRNYTDQEVTKEQLEVLVKAGMAAPSARNLQPWAFIVINEREMLDALADSLPNAKMLLQAQAAIIVCGDMEKAATDTDSAYWVQDCSAASQNILLAAEATGLGAVWTAAYPYQDRISPVRNLLGLPENIIPLNVIPIGYPTGADKPKDKWKPENMHWGKW